MFILGISAFYHNSAAAIIMNGKIIAAAEEERFSRKKNDSSFPEHAIKYCLEEAGVSLNDLSAIVYYEKPFLKFERLIETYLAFVPKGLQSFFVSMPIWIKEKLFLKRMLYQSLLKVETFDRKKVPLLFPEHHLSHAASAFYTSPFEDAAIITMDGIGEWATTTISIGNAGKIEIFKEMRFPHSIGLLYSAFTHYCGFEVNAGEYKLMGLAPYGNKASEEVRRYIELIKTKLCTVYEDGSVFLDMKYFNFHTSLTMTNDRAWEQIFGFKRRKAGSSLEQCYCNLAFAIQSVTEDIVLRLANEAKRLTNARYLCLAGGVALNCVANGKLINAQLFDQVYIQPAAGDAGGSLGAALAAYHIYFEQERKVDKVHIDGMEGSFLGPDYATTNVLKSLKHYKPIFKHFEDEDELLRQVAALLAKGSIVGWHQGRMEFGPRALGARSILADPRDAEMQRALNLKIKFRESFRPFAPIILSEYAEEFFGLEQPSPYMLVVKPIKEKYRNPYPDYFESFSIDEKLKFQNSALSAATHVDYSARIQTVNKEINPKVWKLLNEFNSLTGCPALINTSFNVKDEPIVNTPEEAYECFIKTGIDYLVIGNLLFSKTDFNAIKSQ